MSVELTKDLLKMEQSAGDGYAQALVEGDILVPDTKPDTSRILSVDGTVDITNKEASENKIVVNGAVNLKFYMFQIGGEYPVYMDASAAFTQSIDIPKAAKGMKNDVKAEVEHIEFEKLNERKIGVKASSISLEKAEPFLKSMHWKRFKGSKPAGIEGIGILSRTSPKRSIGGHCTRKFRAKPRHAGDQGTCRVNVNAVEKEKEITDGKNVLRDY